ncbi:hypothetical protein PVAND_001999 [Polypedilum vanderplanki]|uniref:Uncharacterized protein n=1 Tax=Polypedilum vanderplanki TaxID=319348 RepID=A0A9J6BQ34_POLVA|nr:hypothetical protein PVAND_001999 [Polypedilum vanderplanki]
MKTSTERSQEWRIVNNTKESNKIHAQTYREKTKNCELYKLKNRIRRQKNYEKQKKKKLAHNENLNPIGYDKRNSLLKKVNQIKKILPQNETKKNQILKELCKEIVPDIYDRAKKKKLLFAKKLAIEFLNKDSVSILLPGKKDEIKITNENGTKIIMRKRVLKESQKNTYQEFIRENNGIKLSESSFRSVIPKHILSFTRMPRFSCLCKYHEDFRLLFEGIRSYLTKSESILTWREFLSKFSCSTTSHECMLGSCVNCLNIESVARKLIKVSKRKKLVFKQWSSDGYNQLKENAMTSQKFFTYATNQIIEFKKHFYISSVQSSMFHFSTKTYKQNTAIIVQDFSENFTTIQQNEIQQSFYSRSQFTLYTIIVYIFTRNSIVSKSYGFISDSNEHNKYSVNAYMRAIIEEIQETYDVKNVEIWSDGAPSQYKNFYSLSNMINLSQDYNIGLMWHFHCSSHGKNQVDGIGGAIKSMVDRRMKTKNIELNSAYDFYKHAKNICTSYEIRFISKEKINLYKKELDSFWSTIKKITDIRTFHLFVLNDDKKSLDCYETSAKINHKHVTLIKMK